MSGRQRGRCAVRTCPCCTTRTSSVAERDGASTTAADRPSCARTLRTSRADAAGVRETTAPWLQPLATRR